MGSPVIPALHYADASAAVDFLCEAFGFRRHAVHERDGAIGHAELTLGDAMVMLGTHDPQRNEYQRMVGTVAQGNAPTMSIYLVLADDDAVDAMAERARVAGAEVALPPEDQPYGGRNCCCRDLEGNLWNFGSYDPWATDGA